MAIRKICVQEVTSFQETLATTVTCTTPAHTPIGAAFPSECNVSLFNVDFAIAPIPTISFSYDTQLKYACHQSSATFEDFCNVLGASGSITFDSGITFCECPQAFTITSAITCNPASITTTQSPNTVAGHVIFSFSLENLCALTIICVDDTICP